MDSTADIGAAGSQPAGGTHLARLGPPIAAVCVYALIAALAYWPVEPFSRSSLSYCACGDTVQETWFLAWPAYALHHGLNPFFTALLDYPHGVNLALNTSMPLLGTVAAPLVWLRGPVAAFNVMMRLSFVLSASSMLFVVRRIARWWPSAFLAGLLYGFSPYMTGQGFGHLFLTFVPLPPLIFLCLYELWQRTGGGRRVLRVGLLLGVLCTAQFFISIEVLVTTGVCCAVVAGAAVLSHRREAVPRIRRAATGVGTAVGLFAPVVTYPVWFFLQGPQHVVGPPHEVPNLAPIKADLFGYVVPSANQRIGPAHLIAVGTSFVAGDRPENGVYLGIPLIVLLLYLAVRFRHDSRIALGAAMALTGAVLALGTPLAIDNHSTGLPLPFDVLRHLPLVQGVAAVRFTLYVQLGAALVLGVGLARLRESGWRATRGAAAGGRVTWRLEASVVGVGVLALVAILPRYPYPHQPVGLPKYVTTAAIDAVPPGSVVLTYPYDVDPVNEAMLWQAVSGMRFAIFGGQASTPGAGGAATSTVAALEPGAVQQLFAAGLYGDATPNGAPLPPLDSSTVADIRTFCARYHVGTVLVEPQGVDLSAVISYLSVALGAPPVASGGLDVWTGVPADLNRLTSAPKGAP